MIPKKQIDTPYHHPNLRQALLNAAVTLVGEVGPRAFTLREVARRAGVSHNAPYRHFTSKDDLLTTVAIEGFERLTRTMLANQGSTASPSKRLILAGCGYVEFALKWPNHFAIMFDSGAAPPNVDCTPANAGEEAFRVLLDSIIAAQQSGDLPPGDPMPHAFTAWSLVHGIAKLAIGGNLPMDHDAILNFTSIAALRMLTPHSDRAKS
ncbi:TetR/AcrR family transcriptional regulator [Acidicapsa dinghuensis]|uniref:TetR/AcrR family transcriptional regulator n=1 Tax=Acidicapsa dinghuensis TaxID=2218256 RepID=A0ABW1ENR0_9BACT|nr:TetR/AcrR family transcriptional regulator [Acidicapsa dinghuensis]